MQIALGRRLCHLADVGLTEIHRFSANKIMCRVRVVSIQISPEVHTLNAAVLAATRIMLFPLQLSPSVLHTVGWVFSLS